MNKQYEQKLAEDMENSFEEFLDYDGLEILVSKIKKEIKRIEDKIDSNSGGNPPENLTYLSSDTQYDDSPSTEITIGTSGANIYLEGNIYINGETLENYIKNLIK